MKRQKMLLGTFSVALFLLFFQSSAFLARHFLSEGFFCNPEGPFGVVVPDGALWSVTALALVFFLFQWWIETDTWADLGWLLLFTAGASNLLERLTYGCVFDFLSLPFLPLFNSADIALSLSVVFLLWRSMRH